jgi:hypothetical protein
MLKELGKDDAPFTTLIYTYIYRETLEGGPDLLGGGIQEFKSR